MEEAETVYQLCQAYHSLPEVGGVMDQPIWMLRNHAILNAVGYFERES